MKNWSEYYFREVLGVHHLMRPLVALNKEPETSVVSSSSLKGLRVLFVARAALPDAEKELLQKIFQAVQIDPTTKELMFLSSSDEKLFLEKVFIAQDVVCFDEEMAQYLRSHLSDLSIIQLEGLREMIAHPEKKKVVWSQLKSLMENKWSIE